MDDIMEIYERVKDRLTLEEFLGKVDETESFMGGLADKITAARLVIHNMGETDNQLKVNQVTPDISNVTVLGKIISCSDVRTFNREDGSTGNVANLTLADETGSIRIVLWDEASDLVKIGEIVFGDSIKVSGFVKEGRNGLEISVGRGGSIDKLAIGEEIDVRKEPYKIDEIKSGMSEIHILGKILDISNLRTFKRKDGSNGNVRNMTIGDATGKIRVTLWDELANTIDTFVVGDAIEIFGGYAKENTFNNQVEVNLGNNSSLRKSSKQVEFKEVITQITDIEIKESYNIVGHVTGLDELKEFQKKDGSTGRVVNIHISDNSGRIKVSLWGEQTDILREIDLGTKLQINDCYAKPGWNDEIELSVGERARIIILEK
jgi:replication factor A1